MDALQMSNLKYKMNLHKDEIWSITYKTKQTAYSVLKTLKTNYAFRLVRRLLPWKCRTRPFLDTLLGHPILYMAFNNPPKTYQIRLIVWRYCSLKSPAIYTSILSYDKRIKIFSDIHFRRIILYRHIMDIFFHIGHVGNTFHDSNFG